MTVPHPPISYPLRIEGTLDCPLSRGLWLVKWVLAIPHFVILAFLLIGLLASTVVAWFAILLTGRYPRSLFDFNVGVLRWSWRVGSYSYSALGTDRYPPFTLKDVPDYPARLEVDYRSISPVDCARQMVAAGDPALPDRGGVRRRRLGARNAEPRGCGTDARRPDLADGPDRSICLLFTARYPKPIYDFVLGMNRWVFRVGAYSLLMTDRYPPFRLDMGGQDPPPEPVSTATGSPVLTPLPS